MTSNHINSSFDCIHTNSVHMIDAECAALANCATLLLFSTVYLCKVGAVTSIAYRQTVKIDLRLKLSSVQRVFLREFVFNVDNV